MGGSGTCLKSQHLDLGGRGRWISGLEASLVYRASSRIARATWRNPVSKERGGWGEEKGEGKKKKL